MKRSLSSTIQKNKPASEGGQIDTEKNTGGGIRNDLGKAPEVTSGTDLNEVIGEYSGMSEAELMRELKSATLKKKAEGTFDSSEIERGVKKLAPMLNQAQLKKLYEILGQL